MINNKTLVILDMNGTFVFNHDRFSNEEDYSVYYKTLENTTLSDNKINEIIKELFEYMSNIYSSVVKCENFPTLYDAINHLYEDEYSQNEIKNIVDTFTFHEMGHIPEEYKKALFKLEQNYDLALVSDIWSPKDMFIEMLKKEGVYDLFSYISYSSEINIIKPSATPIEIVLKALGKSKKETVFIGDSMKRDLGSALLANIDCILVGDEEDEKAIFCLENLLNFSQKI